MNNNSNTTEVIEYNITPTYSIPLTTTEPVFLLTESQKLLILLICFSVVVIVVIITACIVTECCWFTPSPCKCCQKDNQKSQWKRDRQTSLIDISPLPYYTTNLTLAKTSSEFSLDPMRIFSKDSAYGSFSMDSQKESVFGEEGEDFNDSEDTNYGQITFSVRFIAEPNQRMGQLCIFLKEAQDLPPKFCGGACDPYAVIKLYFAKGRSLKLKEHSLPFCTFKTNIKRKTRHPLFMENFVVSMAKSDLKTCVAKFLIFDREKHANDSELGQCVVNLKEYHLLKDNQGQEITVDLNSPKEENGKICFGMSYLPTAERMTFTIIKADHLRLTTDNPAHFAPYVSVSMLRRGKVVQKRKTAPCCGSSFPVFNEVLIFDVPASELENIAFLIVVTDDGNGSDSPASEQVQKRLYIGKVVVGMNIRGKSQEQWNAMIKSPRKLFIYWHTLR